MILDHISNASRYLGFHTDFVGAFAFLQECNIDHLSEGKHVILGDRIFALVSKTKGKGIQLAKLESHRKYIDIQYVLQGKDKMGWRNLESCQSPEPYQAEKDILFYTDTPESWVDVEPGYFAIFFPEDAHAPLAGEGDVFKIVIKVAVAYNKPSDF